MPYINQPLRTTSLRELGYPHKLYLLLILLVGSLINLKMIYDLRLPSGYQPYLFINWNFFLAWLPVVFMLLLDMVYLMGRSVIKRVLMVVFGGLWLFFYPNAAYMVTDLLHVFARYSYDPNQRFWGEIPFWEHLLTLFLVALLGLLLGSIALFSVHNLVRRACGALWSWVFAIGVLVVSSFGIYAGRFMRWNSWDLATIPASLARELKHLFGDVEQIKHMLSFCWPIFLITLVCYLVVFLFARIKLED